MSILEVNQLALDLVARDFSDGHAATQAGPTKTSRALAIVHLAARDAFGKVSGAYTPILAALPNLPSALALTEDNGKAALLGAGIRAATLLYPDFGSFIAAESMKLTAGADMKALTYGAEVADRWIASRQNDGSNAPQLDDMYSKEPGHHRPDPVSKASTLGRNWGFVKPFVIGDVETDAPLGAPPAIASQAYADSFDEVFVKGRDNTPQQPPPFPAQAALGIFWGYDGSNKLGTPPRLYNQIVVSAPDFKALDYKTKVNVLAAVNAAMADAGIAAWYWKYYYDFWRPVVAIREAEKGWGPSGKGDGNSLRKEIGNPFWLPLGAPKSNAVAPNFTPNFPAYPSGHATFGTACFLTLAGLLEMDPDKVVVTFVSEEFSGKRNDTFNPGTTDNTGALRPRWEQTFDLAEAIRQNKVSRIFLGVHWDFDATGGEEVGKAIAAKTIGMFQ